MEKRDIVVIGAGPSGSYAAMVAAESGCKTLLLEEHHAVGQPRHCPGWLLGTDFTEKLVKKFKDKIPMQKVHAWHIYEAESGRMLEEIPDTGWGGYLVNRQFFDREIALSALRAGAELSIGTRVVDLIREGDRVAGVKTNSKRLPEIMADVVICADGIRSLHGGFARKELAADKEEEEYRAAILMELNGVDDIRPGILEGYVSNDEALAGRNLWTYAENACFLSIQHIDLFWNLQKRDDNLFSKKIKNARPTQINGYFMRLRGGRFCDRVVDNGILFVGDACGNSGIIHGMISAYYGAATAAEAVKEKDINILKKYDRILRGSDIYKYPYH